jgi:molybdate transport system substrate-binding protein
VAGNGNLGINMAHPDGTDYPDMSNSMNHHTRAPQAAQRRLGALLALLAGLCCASLAQAAEIVVWSAGAVQAPMLQLVADYEKASGHTVKVEYAPVGVWMRRLAQPAKPDVLVISQDVLETVQNNGWTLPPTAAPLGRVGVGVAVAEGAARPDISSPQALRQALLNAKSITYMDPNKGTSGKHFAWVLEQLGIAEQVKSKTKLGDVGFVVEPVARGEVELGIQQITEILPVAGARLLGPLPEPLQKITTYYIAQTAEARQVAVARDFITFVTSARARAVFVEKGFAAP